MIDWLCYQAVMLLPLWKLDPHTSRLYADFILPRAGRYAFGEADK